MFGSRDFATLKLIFAVNCSEFAMRSAIERARVQLRNLKFPIVSNANSIQFSTLKSGNLENQTFAHSMIMKI